MSRKVRNKNLFECSHVLWRLQQARTPFRENFRDLILVFLRNEIVQTRLCLQKCGIERHLSAIMGMQMEIYIAL